LNDFSYCVDRWVHFNLSWTQVSRKRTHKEGGYPYLFRHISSAYPNHIWGIDITYIRLSGGWMYLVAVLDWYSRYARELGAGSDTGITLCLVYGRVCVRKSCSGYLEQ